MYLDEIALELSNTLGVTPALSTIHQTLKLLGYTTKKVCYHCPAATNHLFSPKQLSKIALEHCKSSRQAFTFQIGEESPDWLVFTDESAINLHTTYCSMGQALQGERVQMTTYFQWGDQYVHIIFSTSFTNSSAQVLSPTGAFNGWDHLSSCNPRFFQWGSIPGVYLRFIGGYESIFWQE